jgi:hypothetical protein
MAPPKQRRNTDTELAAMRRIAAALEPLKQAERDRIVTWIYDRYKSLQPVSDFVRITDAESEAR